MFLIDWLRDLPGAIHHALFGTKKCRHKRTEFHFIYREQTGHPDALSEYLEMKKHCCDCKERLAPTQIDLQSLHSFTEIRKAAVEINEINNHR